MSDLYEKIVSQRSGFEKLMAKVPGYRGYKEASDRRAADRLIREHVVRLLKEQMTRLNPIEKKILSGGGLSFASKTREAKTQFQIFIDRVNTATPGYSGFYDSKKVGPDELDKIYSFDAALISYVDRFREAIDALDAAAGAKDTIDQAVTALEVLAREANDAFKLRESTLMDLA
jgi:hypothetical protein